MMKRCIDQELGAMLHAYELGALGEEDVERFELHTMKCEFCYSEIASFDQYTEAMRQSVLSGELADQAVSPEPESGRLWRYLWPRAPLLLRPALLLLALLALIYPAYLGLVPDSDVSEQARAVQMIRFSPTRTTQTNSFGSGSGQDGVISYSFEGAIAGKEYEIVVLADDSSVVAWYTEVCTTDHIGRGDILLPLTRMNPGTYRLMISDPSDSTAHPQEYYFRLAE